MLPVPCPSPEPGPSPEPDLKPKPKPKPQLTTTADAGGNYLNVGYMMSYAENNTLMQRMGDMRRSGTHGNMWLNHYAGKFEAFSGIKLSGFKMNYAGMQIGADKRLADNIPVWVGAFIGSTQASPNYRGGTGITHSDYVGLYSSYISPEGYYTDAVLKAGWQK